MPEYAITCGCGRTMTPDGRADHDAYRCGCGAHIKVAAPRPPATQCVGTHRGQPCRMVITIREPFPLCEQHDVASGLSEYRGWISGTPDEIREEINARTMAGIREALDGELPERGLKKVDNHIMTVDKNPVVYFLRVDSLVKIGTTVNLIRRMKTFNLPTLVVLATEPGYVRRERELHRRFAELRYEREWFHLEGPLVDYINEIRASHGIPALAT